MSLITALIGFVVVALLIVALSPVIGKIADNVRSFGEENVCAGLGVRHRCLSTPNCDGRAGWTPVTTQASSVACETGYCCFLAHQHLYYPRGTVLLEVQGRVHGLFRVTKAPVEGIPSDEQHCTQGGNSQCLIYEGGSELAKRYLETGLPKDAKIVVHYRRKPEQSPDGDMEEPPYCGVTFRIASQTVPQQSTLTRCSPRGGSQSTLSFPPLNEPIAPRDMVANSATVFGADAPEQRDLTITIYHGFTRNQRAQSEQYTVKVSRSLERTLAR